MRLFIAAILTLVVSWSTLGQTYTISTVAGTGPTNSVGTFGGDNGPATSAQLNLPYGVAVDSAGNLYISDTSNNRIRKVSNGVITTVAGDGTQGYSGDNGPAISAQLNYPYGVAVDSAGNLYIVDRGNNRIRKVSNGVITTVAGNGSGGYTGNPNVGDNGPATSAQLNYPAGVAIDFAGNLYIADYGNNRIRKVSNGVITTVAGNGNSGNPNVGDNGPAINAQLYDPCGVAVDSAGNLYIADTQNYRIRKVANGVITTFAGNGTAGFSGDGAPATVAQLYTPNWVALDSAGNLYIADYFEGRIRKVSNGSAGGIANEIITIAGSATQGFSGDNGPATSAQLTGPQSVAVGITGNVYIVDTGNNRIRVLTPVGSPCAYSVIPASFQASAAGGNLTVSIQTGPSCAWTISGLPNWITFSGNVIGTGPGSITLSVAANPGGPRTATVSIAGVSVQVNQSPAPCAYALSPGNQAFPAAGGTGSVSVTTTSGCSWTASSNVTWVTITGGASGTGNGTVTYKVAANTGGAQSGSLTVAGLPFTVEQSGTVTGPGNMAGNWQFSGQSSLFGLSFSVTGQIAQSGNNVSGQLAVSGSPCATSAVLSGTVSSTSVMAMNLNENGQVVAFSGTLSSDGNSATGTYTAPSGGCTSGDKGTWSGQRVSASLSIAAVSNAASGLAAIAPNTWVSIYGANFAAAGFSDDWSKSILNGTLPTTLDGVSVSAGGIPAYVSFVSPGQINVLTPNVAPGNSSVTVQTAAGTSTPVTVTSQPFSPAFFPWPNGQPVATHLDYGWAVKNGTFAGATTVPAKPGEYIILWGTGFGPTTPTAPTGVTIPASTTYYTANPVYVTIAGVNAPVYAAALASGFAGLYQVVAMVPATLSNGDYSLVATVGGVATAATTLTVHN